MKKRAMFYLVYLTSTMMLPQAHGNSRWNDHWDGVPCFSILVNGGRYSRRYLRWETSSVPEAFGLVTYCVFSVNMCMYYVMYYVMYSYRTHDVSWHIWSSKIVVGCLMRSVSSLIFSQAASQTRYFVPPTVPFVEIHPSPFSPVVCWATGLPCLPRWSLPWYCSMVESWPWKDLLKWLVSVVYSLQSEGKKSHHEIIGKRSGVL